MKLPVASILLNMVSRSHEALAICFGNDGNAPCTCVSCDAVETWTNERRDTAHFFSIRQTRTWPMHVRQCLYLDETANFINEFHVIFCFQRVHRRFVSYWTFNVGIQLHCLLTISRNAMQGVCLEYLLCAGLSASELALLLSWHVSCLC